MAKEVNPAIFIGLGGTGHKVLLQLKSALLSNYGEVPTVIDMLCFDTDLELLATSQELTYDKKNSGLVTEKVTFDNNEVLGIPIKNPDKLLKFQHIKSWLSDRIAPRIGPTDTGAKQIRQMGRFAIFENYNTQAIKDKIKRKIDSLKDQAKLKTTEYIIKGKPRVHLVFSPCGGTGAGTYIDIVMAIKDIDPRMEVYGWLVMPDFYTSYPMTHSVVKNTYGSLIEMDHMMGKDANPPNCLWSNYPKNPYEVDYSGSGQKVSLGTSSFFTHVYLFDNVTEKGNSIMDVKDVYDRIGRILYLMVSGPGDAMQSAYSNNDDYMWPTSPETNGKRRNYSSMGISQIILDKNYLKELKINRISLAILSTYAYSGEIINPRDIDTFIDSNSWREDRGKDQVIDSLMPRNQLKYETEPLLPSKFKKGCNAELTSNINLFLREWDEKTLKNCNKIRDEIYNNFETKIIEQILNYLSQKGGLQKCKQFINFIFGSFQGMADEIKNEAETHKSNKEKLIKDVAAYLEAIVSEENSFIPIGKEKRIKETCSNYIHNSEKILFESYQNIRKESALLFYNKCLVYLKDKLSQIQKSDNLINEALAETERDSQNLLNTIKVESDFERYIHNFYKDILVLNDSDINLQEAFSGAIDFKSILQIKFVTDIKKIIREYVLTTDAVKSISDLTVEKILQGLPKKIIKNMVSYLDSASSTCIDIDAASFLNNSGRTTMQKFGFICVEDEKDTIFKPDGEVYDSISNEGGYTELKVFSTGDPDKITMIKVAGMFPACSIKKVKDYKAQFELSMSCGGYHYSDTYFEKNAIDLIDAQDEGDSLKWFAVGSALGKIYLDRGGIYLEYFDKQMMPLFEGNRNKNDRSYAYDFFKKNKNYIAYIEKYYLKFRENGKPAITEKFVDYYQKITSIDILGKQFKTIDKQSSEYKHIFLEKNALKQFAESWAKINPEVFGDE